MISLRDAAELHKERLATGQEGLIDLADMVITLAEELDKVKELFDPADYVPGSNPDHQMSYEYPENGSHGIQYGERDMLGTIISASGTAKLVDAMDKMASGDVERVPLSEFLSPKPGLDSEIGDNQSAVRGRSEFRISLAGDDEDAVMLHLHHTLLDYHIRKRDEATAVLDRMNHVDMIRRVNHYIRHVNASPPSLQDQMADVLGKPRDRVEDTPPDAKTRLKQLGALISNMPMGNK